MKAPDIEDLWEVQPFAFHEAGALAEDLGISRLLAHLLVVRGIDTPDAIRTFLDPVSGELPDPTALPGIDNAIARIETARDRGEKVMIFGDYDVDGISGAAVLTSALRRYGIESVVPRLPVRDSGFGLNTDMIDEAARDGVGLVITADNGTAAIEAANRAREHGIDLIITDHHTVGDELPACVACVNPQLLDGDTELKQLSGAGVAFCLARALTDSDEEIDLAALGTIADLMPMRGLNRTIVARGLRMMRDRPRVGFTEIAAVANLSIEQITAEQIAFQIAPRMNAAGRLADPMIALNMLLTEDVMEAAGAAAQLHQLNEQRKEMERSVSDDAEAEIDAMGAIDRHAIVVARRGWHAGVIGIVAARMQNRYECPAAIIAIDENGQGRGSVRTGPRCNAAEALAACGEWLVQHGGHSAAGGFSIEEHQVEPFTAAFSAEAKRQAETFGDYPRLTVDAQIALSEIDMHLVDTLEHMRPYGNGNKKPVFCTCGAEHLADSMRLLKGNHVQISVREGPRIFRAIGFNMGHRAAEIAAARKLDIAYTPSLNEWKGAVSIQLELRDIRTV